MTPTRRELIADEARAELAALAGATRRAVTKPATTRVTPTAAQPSAAPTYEPGLPSLLAGAGKDQFAAAGRRTIDRPTYTQEQVYAALDAALDYNPDASYAAWVYKLLGLRDWDLVVEGEDGEPDELVTDEALAFTERCCLAYGGGIDAMLAVGMESLFRRGAIAGELDVADSLDEVLDVAFVDPAYVDFEPITDGNHKSLRPVYLPSTGGDPVPFNQHQFTYISHGARVDLPYGKSPFLPLVDAAYPYAELRDGLQRVVKGQGFSKMAFIYDYDQVVRTAPPDAVQLSAEGGVKVLDWNKLKAHLDAFVEDLQDEIEEMYDDDRWVLPDMVKPGSVGANHATESMDFAKIAQLFDQDAIVATKSQPAIHGRQWGSDLSSTGSVQWTVQALGIEAMRDYVRRFVEFVVDGWLTVTGRRGAARLVFPPLRKEDRKAEAEADKLVTENAILLRDAGAIDNDEMAEMTVGHPATGAPATVDVPPAPFANGRTTPARQLPLLVGDQGSRADPFTPEVTDAAGPVEMENEQQPPGEVDARRVVRAFDEWARDEAESFDGLLDAVVVTSAPEASNGRAKSNGNGHARALSAPAGRWQWDATVARWRYPSDTPNRLGRLLPPERADEIFERRMAARKAEAVALAERFTAGRMTTREFQDAWARVAKDAHLEARMIAAGGKNAMTPTHYGAVGGRAGTEYRVIGSLGKQIESGELSAAQIRQAVARRFDAPVRETYRRGREYVHSRAGYMEERNHLEPGAMHCPGCEAEAGRGWVALGSIKPVGQRDCSTGCACHIEFRVSAEQAMPAHRAAGTVDVYRTMYEVPA